MGSLNSQHCTVASTRDDLAITDATPREHPAPAALAELLQRKLGNRAAARLVSPGQPLQPTAQHALARAGVRGRGAALPHLERIQRAFGAHDLRGVEAHTGSDAAAASRTLAAEAYTTGTRIAFADPTPSLHTAAHEAAHVVQQRAGLQLRHGIGAAGDRHERHADAVAERVVRGESAERLLSEVAAPGTPGRAASPALQRAAFDRPQDPSAYNGWKIDHDQVATQELDVNHGPALVGNKTTRLSALISPRNNIDKIGGPTAQNYDPPGWAWILANEARTKSNKLRYWVRFHLLNAKLGGDGKNTAHLTPTDKSTNSSWETGLEHPMKDKVVGKGSLSQPTGVPLYYDVNVTYWTRGDAPSTYDLTNTGGADYSDNITLFPSKIDATWSTFEGNRWVDQKSAPTGPIPKPAGVGGSDVDLLATTTNFTGFSGIYGVHDDIFPILVQQVLPKQPKSYRDVRRVLEAWVSQGASNTNTFVSRSARLFLSDAKLRQALAGKHPQKLKLGGQHVPDDDTPEAREFASPANGIHFDSQSVTHTISSFNTPTDDPIRTGYHLASGQHAKIPRAIDVLTSAFKSPLNRYKLSQLHAAWEYFIDPTNNPQLPPMLDNDFADEGKEVATVVFGATIATLEQEVGNAIGYKQQPTDTDSLRLHLLKALQLQVPGGLLHQRYMSALLAHRTGGGKDYLTIGDLRDSKSGALYRKLLANELQILSEGLDRVIAVRSALFAKLSPRTFFKTDPWSTPLTTPIATTMANELQAWKNQQAKQSGKNRGPDNPNDLKKYKED